MPMNAGNAAIRMKRLRTEHKHQDAGARKRTRTGIDKIMTACINIAGVRNSIPNGDLGASFHSKIYADESERTDLSATNATLLSALIERYVLGKSQAIVCLFVCCCFSCFFTSFFSFFGGKSVKLMGSGQSHACSPLCLVAAF